jgi:hypothetical protein
VTDEQNKQKPQVPESTERERERAQHRKKQPKEEDADFGRDERA